MVIFAKYKFKFVKIGIFFSFPFIGFWFGIMTIKENEIIMKIFT